MLLFLVGFHFSIADAACECKKPMDLVSNMPIDGGMYNYTDTTAVNALNETSWLLPDTYGGTCSGWDADPMSSGFSGGWGCPADWCSDKWCYVDPCECSDYAIGETFMFSGVSLYFSYGLCCGGFSTAATCGGLGAGECTWNNATSTCDQDSPAAYISNRCISKGTDETTCNAFSSCYWVSGACAAKSIADRLGALSCPTTAPPVTVDTQHRMIQNFILSSAITWDDTTELVWEFAYGGLVNVTVTINVTGMVYYNYKTGCRVQMTFKTVPDRRTVLSVVQAETSTAPGVTATGLDTATGAASMASAVNSVKKSNSHYSGVASVSASNFQSVGQAYTYTGTFAGGSFAPSAAPEDHDSELDEYLIIVGVVGAAVLIAIIVLIAVKMSARPTPAKADVETGHVGVTSVPLEPTPKEGK